MLSFVSLAPRLVLGTQQAPREYLLTEMCRDGDGMSFLLTKGIWVGIGSKVQFETVSLGMLRLLWFVLGLSEEDRGLSPEEGIFTTALC